MTLYELKLFQRKHKLILTRSENRVVVTQRKFLLGAEISLIIAEGTDFRSAMESAQAIIDNWDNE